MRLWRATGKGAHVKELDARVVVESDANFLNTDRSQNKRLVSNMLRIIYVCGGKDHDEDSQKTSEYWLSQRRPSHGCFPSFSSCNTLCSHTALCMSSRKLQQTPNSACCGQAYHTSPCIRPILYSSSSFFFDSPKIALTKCRKSLSHHMPAGFPSSPVSARSGRGEHRRRGRAESNSDGGCTVPFILLRGTQALLPPVSVRHLTPSSVHLWPAFRKHYSSFRIGEKDLFPFNQIDHQTIPNNFFFIDFVFRSNH